MATHPHMDKVPVEIWREIFRLVLGPSISDPHQPSLEAYKSALFARSRFIFLRYSYIERQRAPLRRVCRHWKDMADALDDRLVVVCPDGFIWPPFRDPKDAKRVLYYWTTIDQFDNQMSPGVRCLVSGQRAKTINWQPKKHVQATDDYPPPFDPTDYIAPVMDVINCLMDIPDHKPCLVLSETLPRTLQYQYHGVDPNALCGLWNPVFHHLTCLHIRTTFPFQRFYPLDRLSLPDLLYLYLELEWSSVVPHDTSLREDGASVASWRFPKLRMLGLDLSTVYPAPKVGMPALVAAHADTLEELELLETPECELAAAVEWRNFNVLQTIHLTDLNPIPQMISALNRRFPSSYSSPTSKSARLEVSFTNLWLRDDAFDAFNDVILHHPHAFDKVVFHGRGFTWDGIADAPQRRMWFSKPCILALPLEAVSLTMLDKDGEPMDSPAGLRARQRPK